MGTDSVSIKDRLVWSQTFVFCQTSVDGFSSWQITYKLKICLYYAVPFQEKPLVLVRWRCWRILATHLFPASFCLQTPQWSSHQCDSDLKVNNYKVSGSIIARWSAGSACGGVVKAGTPCLPHDSEPDHLALIDSLILSSYYHSLFLPYHAFNGYESRWTIINEGIYGWP